MSTTIKRIALVAVAALSLGVVSVAPSQAAANTLLVYTSGDGAPAGDLNTGSGVAGAFNYVTVTADTWSADSKNDYIITTDSTFGTVGAGTLSTDKKSLVANGLDNVIQVMTPTAGSVTVNYWKRTNGVLAATAAETVVITVNAAAQSGTYSVANSSAIMASGETTTAPLTDATIAALATANPDTAAATVKVVLKDALKAAYNDTVTATVIAGSANVLVLAGSDSTTVGAVSNTSKATAIASSSAVTVTDGIAYVLIFSNGIAGSTSVKISLSDGTTLATKSVTFSSTTVASITPTVAYARVSGDAGAPTTADAAVATIAKAITLTLKDAGGFVIPKATISSATPNVTTFISSVTCGTASDLGVSTCSVVPVAEKYGTTVITFKSGTVTATASITTAAAKASTITVTAPASVEAGSEVTFSFEAKDSTGAAIADGVYAPGAFIAKATSSATNFAFATTDSITVTAGVGTAKVFAPYITGTWKTTWTTQGTAATASAVAVGTNNVAAAIAGATVVTDVAISNAAADAALDAANEAATAAQDATDAAIQAADAADEATAAVAALQLEVNTLIAGLKKQLTTLTTLVRNLAKAVAKK